MKRLNMDGVIGRLTGEAFVSLGLFNGERVKYLSINVYDLESFGRPYPSGYVATYNIPVFQLEEAIQQ